MKDTSIKQIDIKFTLSDLLYGVESGMLQRARKLVLDNEVVNVTSDTRGYQATVPGTSRYEVSVAHKAYDYGVCDCYMGQRGELCKHMIALALYMLREHGLTNALLQNDLNQKTLEQTPIELIKLGCGKLRPYTGNSYAWFAYQNKLDTGVALIRDGLEKLPQDQPTAKYLFSLAKRINKKIANGLDDSNGTVWPVIQEILMQIIACAKEDSKINKDIEKWAEWNSGFDFEDILKRHLQDLNQ